MVYVHSSDLNFDEYYPSDVMAIGGDELYDSLRASDISGGQTWSESEGMWNELQEMAPRLSEQYGFELNSEDRILMARHAQGYFDNFADFSSKNPQSVHPFDKRQYERYQELLTVLNLAAAENPNHFKNIDQIESLVAENARKKYDEAQLALSRATPGSAAWQGLKAGLARDFTEPYLYASIIATAPIALEAFGTSMIARAVGLSLTEAAAAGVAEFGINIEQHDFWRKQGFTETEMWRRTSTNTLAAIAGGAILAPGLYGLGVGAKKSYQAMMAAYAKKDIAAVVKAASQLDAEVPNFFNNTEKADLSIMAQRLKERDQMPAWLDKDNPIDVGLYRDRVQRAIDAFSEGAVPPKFADELSSTQIPKLEAAISKIGDQGNPPTYKALKDILSDTEFDAYKKAIKMAREEAKLQAEKTVEELSFKKLGDGYVESTSKDPTANRPLTYTINKDGKRWKVYGRERGGKRYDIGTTKTLKEAKDVAQKHLQDNKPKLKSDKEIVRSKAEQFLTEALNRRRSGPQVLEYLDEALPRAIEEVRATPLKIENLKGSDPTVKYTDSLDPDKVKRMYGQWFDQELAQKIVDGEFDDAIVKQAFDEIEGSTGRTPEETELYTRLENDLAVAKTRLMDAQLVDDAIKKVDVKALEARASQLDVKDKLTPDEEIEFGNIQEQLFEAENAPDSTKINIEAIEKDIAQIKKSMKELDDRLVVRQTDNPYATPEELQENLDLVKKLNTEEEELKRFDACVIAKGTVGG